MSRLSMLAFGLLASVGIGVSGCASVRPCQTCAAPPPVVAAPGPSVKPFDGSTYGFTPPAPDVASYLAPPVDPGFSNSIPYVPNYYGPFPREAARIRGAQFYQPGPYYYNATNAYTPDYYGYYYTPGYYRY